MAQSRCAARGAYPANEMDPQWAEDRRFMFREQRTLRTDEVLKPIKAYRQRNPANESESNSPLEMDSKVRASLELIVTIKLVG